MAADLVAMKVDVIAAVAGSAPAQAAKQASSTIPIVFTSAGDPVGSGLVAGLARPGENLTRFAYSPADLDPKRLELISELVPQAGTIGLLANPSEFSDFQSYMREMQGARTPRGCSCRSSKPRRKAKSTLPSPLSQINISSHWWLPATCSSSNPADSW